MLTSVGILRPVKTKFGSNVVVRTKHTDQVTKVLLQTPNQLSAESSSGPDHQCSGGLAQSSIMQQTSNQGARHLVIHHVHIQTPSQLSEEAVPHIYSPLHQNE